MADHTETNIPADLNNSGAELLLDRRYNQAVETFVRALKLSKSLRWKEDASTEIEESRPLSIKSLGQSKSRSTRFDSANSNRKESPCTDCGFVLIEANTESSISDSAFIFTEPILIEQDTMTSCRKECILRLTAIIIFNLALSHHLMSLNETDLSARSTAIEKAVSLYELSCKIQYEEDVYISAIHTMAHLNNLGQLHLSMGDLDKSTKCFRSLLKHLVLYTENTEEEERPKNELEIFFQNALGLILRDPAVAAAA